MKNLLTLIGGGDRDTVVFHTALAAARALSAHMDFLHIHVGAAEAARYAHAEFACGAALRNALGELQIKAHTYSELAASHIHDLCEQANVAICDTPKETQGPTASFHEEENNAIERLISHARHSDLIVMGRARQTQGLPPDTLDRLILKCGRPILVTASAAPQTLTGTVMVCWKESVNAARALAAATPLLAKAKRVVFTAIAERDNTVAEAVNDVARRFAWSGVATDVRLIAGNGHKIPDLLATAAEECQADLVVMGAYGRSRTREILFGSCTEAFVQHADKPILLMH
jgi:nucleotide-binding universal stress UspA family protein